MEGVKDELQAVRDPHPVVDRSKVFRDRQVGEGELVRNLPDIPTMHDVVDESLFQAREGISKSRRAFRAGFPSLGGLGRALPCPPNLAVRHRLNTLFRDCQFGPPNGSCHTWRFNFQ